MTADNYSPERADAEVRAFFEDSLRRLQESGVIEFLREEVRQRPGYKFEVIDRYEMRGRGFPASVHVEGPAAAKLDETDEMITEERRTRGISVYAPLNFLPNRDFGIEVTCWSSHEKTTIRKADEHTDYLPSSGTLWRERLPDWDREEMLRRGLDDIARVSI